MRTRWVSLAALLLASQNAAGLEVDTAVVTRDGDAYEIAIDARLSPPPKRVLAVLMDYGRLPELHGRIRESRVLGEPAPDDGRRSSPAFDGCVMLFCRSLERVELIRRTPAGLEAEDVPGRSAFREGHTRWLIAADGSGTRLAYRARLVPGFLGAGVPRTDVPGARREGDDARDAGRRRDAGGRAPPAGGAWHPHDTGTRAVNGRACTIPHPGSPAKSIRTI
jgi:hypothetical protein